MAREMGLGQKTKASDSSRAGKLMPAGFPDGAKIEVRDHSFEQAVQHFYAAKRVGTAALRIDNPLCPIHRLSRVLLLCVPAFGAEFAHSRNRLAAVQTEFCFGAGSGYS